MLCDLFAGTMYNKGYGDWNIVGYIHHVINLMIHHFFPPIIKENLDTIWEKITSIHNNWEQLGNSGNNSFLKVIV